MRTGLAHLPLHHGHAPKWLFKRMVLLARNIVLVLTEEYDAVELLKRLSDPFWFQAFGCVLGFDWHSSGVTTTVCGALKEGLKDVSDGLGIYVCGGKGATSRKTPLEIEIIGQRCSLPTTSLIYASRMSAKVDNNAIQDGYTLYQHTFIFTKSGEWAVIQQGMNEMNRYARRYHWFSKSMPDFVCEPHSAVCCDEVKNSLNLVASESKNARKSIAHIVLAKPEKILKDIDQLKILKLPQRHQILVDDINPKFLYKVFLKTYEKQPADFKTLLGTEGVGPKSLRALSLISELIYGIAPSYKDPTRFSFSHGGKDGFPYPVDKKIYDQSIDILAKAVNESKIGNTEKSKALKRLYRYFANRL